MTPLEAYPKVRRPVRTCGHIGLVVSDGLGHALDQLFGFIQDVERLVTSAVQIRIERQVLVGPIGRT